VVTGRLRLTGWTDPTDKVDDPDRRGREFSLSVLTPLIPCKEDPPPPWTIKGRALRLGHKRTIDSQISQLPLEIL
jgi:hypothetical protein